MPDPERHRVRTALSAAVRRLQAQMDVRLIPEVGMNIVYALAGANRTDDVAGVHGRIVNLHGRPHPVGEVGFGASDHVARIALTAMRFNPDIRSAANIRFSDRYIAIMEDQMMEICSFDRTREPPGVHTMDWGVAFCCKGEVPDVIFDRGAMGKEPMIRFLGENPEMVVHNILKLSGRIHDATE
ncbi:MAG: thiamine-phosphate synthase family protein [Methanomicrobiales archaeon]